MEMKLNEEMSEAEIEQTEVGNSKKVCRST